MEKTKILFLAANPVENALLKLDKEIREITAKIRMCEYRDSLFLISGWAVQPDDLLQLLNEHRPQIVHFSGHGTETGAIILTGSHGQPQPVSKEALVHLFKTMRDNIRVVLLNACYTQVQAEAIVEHIDCVIGMSQSIGDQAARIFAASFYRAIGFGRTVQDAFDQGVTALLLEGIQEADTPQLLVRKGIDPSRIILANPVVQSPESITNTGINITHNVNINNGKIVGVEFNKY